MRRDGDLSMLGRDMSNIPTPAGQNIYLYRHGQQSGPYSREQAVFMSNTLGNAETYYWTPGQAEWRPLEELTARKTAEDTHLPATRRVLLVDDDPVMREYLAHILDAGGIPNHSAAGFPAAVQLLQRETPATYGCVVSDYEMPGGTGLDLVRWIKQREEALEVVLLTAKNDKETVKQALRAGVFDFLEKPIHDQAFVRVIRSAIVKSDFNRQKNSQRYRVESCLGQGGSGAVYVAWDTHLQRRVALKRLHEPEGATRADHEELIGEALRLAKLQHPNIVNVYDCGVDQQGPFLVMEYLEGRSLEQLLPDGQTWPLRDIHRLVTQSLDALHYAHDLGFAHLDLKPSNIMVTGPADVPFHVKLIDFGISRLVNMHSREDERNGYIKASPGYVAPERLQRMPVDHRADLYSLGCIIYRLVAGEEAAGGGDVEEILQRHLTGNIKPLHERAAAFPSLLSEWVMGLMKNSATHRPPSAQVAKSDWVRRYQQSGTGGGTSGFHPGV